MSFPFLRVTYTSKHSGSGLSIFLLHIYILGLENSQLYDGTIDNWNRDVTNHISARGKKRRDKAKTVCEDLLQ